jgi:PleD family two-component response regulator
VFEPFERLRSDLNEGVSGTGIGLTISRELAQLHGGSAHRLPAVSRRRAFHSHPTQQAMTKILIAEDDDHTRDALREVLTMEGYEVIAASDGLQAVDFFRAESPTLSALTS